jgi:hypothetical protein
MPFDKLCVLTSNFIDFIIEFIHTQKQFRDIIDENIVKLIFGTGKIINDYDNPYDYIITEETFRKSRNYYDYNLIDVIADDIDKYNKKVLKIDFNEPSAVIVACIFEGKYCYVYLENDKVFNKQELIEAEEKLQEIVEKNEKQISEKKTENKKIVEELKEKLRKQILNDENFLACSNKQLRKNYTRTLFKEKLGNEYRALKDLWTTEASVGVYTDAIDFVEMIWKEIKQK